MSTRLQGLLRHWVCAPLYDLDEIQQRQEAVEFFLHHEELAQQLRTSLKPGEAEGKGESLEGAWRIIPVSKWLVTPIYKPFRPFIRGIAPFKGLTNHGY